jgi:hypothetical protein
MTISRKRGRPVGTAPNREQDERLIQRAVRSLLCGVHANATAAFRALLNQDDPEFPSVLRRLQRRWQHEGERYLEEARRQAFSKRWQFEADQFEKASPELARIINTFAASAVGKAVLLQYGKDGIPAEPMSLGAAKLWEEIVRHSAVGPLRAEALFEKAYASWSVTGLEPDEAFLRRFAELCLTQADALKAHAGMNAGDSDGERDHKDIVTHSEGQNDER